CHRHAPSHGPLYYPATTTFPGGDPGPTLAHKLPPPPSTTLFPYTTPFRSTDGVTSVNAGGSTTYTIVATNNGPSAVTGATVTDTAPAGLTIGSWTCAASAGSSCPAGGSGNISASVNLLNGGAVTLTGNASL